MYRVDEKRMVLAGHSLGGFSALMTLASDQEILSAASIAGFNLGVFSRSLRENRVPIHELIKHYENELPSLYIPSARHIFDEVIRFGESWDLTTHAKKMARAPILLVGASRDQDAPVDSHHTPLVRALKAAQATHVTDLILETDHYFSNRRITLARAILSWLDSQ
jgi:dipeptidyl aminopeptidase/acylaminoacyl peptidase